MERERGLKTKFDKSHYYNAENINFNKQPTSPKYDTNKNQKSFPTSSSQIKYDHIECNIDRAFQKTKLNCQVSPTESNVSNINFLTSKPAANTLSNSRAKMGSRRIFTPQFKIQVLESYRNDNDCKGNQRATARKYNIHRRQIQKWLQCESNLRSSVANINQNNVKHQFHNITHQQLTTNTTNNDILRHHHHGNLSLETQGMPNMSHHIGSCSATVACEGLPNAAKTSTVKNVNAIMSPVRPTAIVGSARKSLSPTILHPHHHQIYTIPFPHAPSSIVVALPPSQHLSHYQYHNMPSAHMHPNFAQASSSNSTFLPTNCLPVTAAATYNTTAINSYSYELVNGEKQLTNNVENNSKDELNKSLKEITMSGISDMTSSSFDRNMNAFKQTESNVSNYTYAPMLPFNGSITAPMDLSINSRRFYKDDNTTEHFNTNCQSNVTDENPYLCSQYRKRKVYKKELEDSPVKQLKINDSNCCSCDAENKEIKNDVSTELQNEVEAEEVDVETQEQAPPIKPIKLFKPYLLDDKDDKDELNKETNNTSSDEKLHDFLIVPNKSGVQQTYDSQSFDTHIVNNSLSNFQALESHTFPKSGSIFQETNFKQISNCSIPNPSHSPTSFRCPKGSPVSGYESSSSTCSESNESFASTGTGSFSFQLNVQSICKEKIKNENRHQLQKWLDQERIASHTHTTKSSMLYMLA